MLKIGLFDHVINLYPKYQSEKLIEPSSDEFFYYTIFFLFNIHFLPILDVKISMLVKNTESERAPFV